jgi:hypothetical protein
MAVAPFFFQIDLQGWEGAPSAMADHSIVVEVSPSIIAVQSLTGSREKTEREFAEVLARRVAVEITGGEADHSARELVDSVAQLGSLQEDLEGRAPTLQRDGIRAWLL